MKRGELTPLVIRALREAPASAHEVSERLGAHHGTVKALMQKLRDAGFLYVKGHKPAGYHGRLERVYAVVQGKLKVMRRGPHAHRRSESVLH